MFLKWADFGFNRTRHNILQVNKSSYEQCVDNDYIFNITRGGRDVFQLLEPKPYYFICGRGYCLKGMKLAITALPQPPPSAPTNFTSTTTSLIPPNAITATILIFAFKALLLWLCLNVCLSSWVQCMNYSSLRHIPKLQRFSLQ